MPRKVVQITGDDSLYALCDDGTIWFRVWGDPEQWQLQPPIPQGMTPEQQAKLDRMARFDNGNAA
jgi:hypothetical protein